MPLAHRQGGVIIFRSNHGDFYSEIGLQRFLILISLLHKFRISAAAFCAFFTALAAA
jgi:hypothetical protein